MAQLPWHFDSAQVEPSVGFDPVPPGAYVAQIVDSEVKSTKSGTGTGLNLTWEICTGPEQGRKFWQWLNIVNDNEKAQAIALGELSAICRATGVGATSDSSALHHRPCQVTVSVGMLNGQTRNEVKKVAAYASNGASVNVASVTAHKAAPMPSAPAMPAKKLPWGSK